MIKTIRDSILLGVVRLPLVRRFRPVIANVAVTTAILAQSAVALAGNGSFAQLVLPFDSPRPYTFDWDQVEHALVLEIQKTSPHELPAVDRYDERLIRRVIVRDLGPAGTELRLVLRDRNVRATVVDFAEPFRIAIDLFDREYSERRDAKTGLPLVQAESAPPVARDSVPSVAVSETRAQIASPIPEREIESTDPAGGSGSGRRLLQMPQEVFVDSAGMNDALGRVSAGVGKSWATYPVYVYRLQSRLLGTMNDGDSASAADASPARLAGASGSGSGEIARALSSSEAMADFAARLFAIGHENRALLAYQQVLHKDAALFEKDAGHLWRFAEVHLGQGNLTLAEGYFDALAARHPAHELADFARLRVLDVRAIRAVRTGRIKDLGKLADQAARINPGDRDELRAQIALRSAWWRDTSATGMPGAPALPRLNDALRSDLGASFDKIEGQRTAFLASTLLVGDMVRADAPWAKTNGAFAAGYFQRFSGRATEPYRGNLRDQLQTRLSTVIQSQVASGRFMGAIQDFEALPPLLQSIRKVPATAWALGEAYRSVGPTIAAIPFYELAIESGSGPDRFRAQFWLAVTAGNAAEEEIRARGASARTNNLKRKSVEADRGMAATWASLKADEQKNLSVALKTPMESTVTSPTMLRTPPTILLANWTQAFSTSTSTTNGGDATDWQRNFSPATSATRLVTDLGTRFGELGLPKERREALQLLRRVKPANTDQEAQKVWSDELLKLAEEYRTNNDYLEAGRLYTFVGNETANLEARAEALYKGGLLLYRAGRREEAVAAFQKAKSDGNNVFYANLADERLNQIENQ